MYFSFRFTPSKKIRWREATTGTITKENNRIEPGRLNLGKFLREWLRDIRENAKEKKFL